MWWSYKLYLIQMSICQGKVTSHDLFHLTWAYTHLNTSEGQGTVGHNYKPWVRKQKFQTKCFFKKLYELEEHYHFLLLQLSKERTDQMNLVLLIIFVFVTCFGKLCFRKSMLSSGISEPIYIWPKSNLKCLLGTHCQGVVTLEVRQCRCTWSR